MAIGAYLTSLYIFVDWIGVEHGLSTNLVTEVHCPQVFCGVIDGTAQQIELTVEVEECSIAPVGIKAAVLEHRTDASVTLDKRILAVVEEVTVGTVYGFRVI